MGFARVAQHSVYWNSFAISKYQCDQYTRQFYYSKPVVYLVSHSLKLITGATQVLEYFARSNDSLYAVLPMFMIRVLQREARDTRKQIAFLSAQLDTSTFICFHFNF